MSPLLAALIGLLAQAPGPATLVVGGGGGGSVKPQYCTAAGVTYGASPAAAWSIAAQANMPTPAAFNGSNVNEAALQFTATATTAEIQCVISPDYDATGTPTAFFRFNSTGTTGNTVWKIEQCITGDGDDTNCTYGSSQTVTVAAQGTTLRLASGSIASVTKTGWTANKTLKIRVTLDASTTVTLPVNLFQFRVSIPQA